MIIHETRIHRIPSSKGFDSIDIFIDWFGEHQSRVTIRSGSSAVTTCWGGHWCKDVEVFMISTNTDYLVGCFSRSKKNMPKNLLTSIIEHIRDYFISIGFKEYQND